mmetsp:Transcript_22311/g.34086  ORF Transcript_22311/g.34086 Transcript_22311/m.34086 type:complete len:129 (+) Transcript_22311:1115-1501(+)
MGCLMHWVRASSQGKFLQVVTVKSRVIRANHQRNEAQHAQHHKAFLNKSSIAHSTIATKIQMRTFSITTFQMTTMEILSGLILMTTTSMINTAEGPEGDVDATDRLSVVLIRMFQIVRAGFYSVDSQL